VGACAELGRAVEGTPGPVQHVGELVGRGIATVFLVRESQEDALPGEHHGAPRVGLADP
jgi:hypothetical protein